MTKKWRALSIAAAVLCVAALLTYIEATQPHPAIPAASSVTASKTVSINGHTINVEVVDTPAAREKGLGGRDSLAADHGMLFVFQKDDEYAFWMKDMRFPIDIIWISATGTIVAMSTDVLPSTYPATFSPKSAARYVLEFPANAVKRYDMRVGDIVRL